VCFKFAISVLHIWPMLPRRTNRILLIVSSIWYSCLLQYSCAAGLILECDHSHLLTLLSAELRVALVCRLSVRPSVCLSSAASYQVKKSRRGRKLPFSDSRRCRFPTKEVSVFGIPILSLNFPKTGVFSRKFSSFGRISFNKILREPKV